MFNILRPAPFVLVSTNHGTMIVNRNDRGPGGEATFGVGHQIFHRSSYEQEEVDTALQLIAKRGQHFGDGVVAIDCGANIGVHTIEWGRFLAGRGRVIAFEAQEQIYYALAGNIAINNCLNVTAHHAAVGAVDGFLEIPVLDYLRPASFGSLSLKKQSVDDDIGQAVDYEKTVPVRLMAIDSLSLHRVDFVKIDVEGMEEEVLAGARKTIETHRPILLVEIIKSDRERIAQTLERIGYHVMMSGMNFLAVHRDDPTLRSMRP